MNLEFSFKNYESAQFVIDYIQNLLVKQKWVSMAQVCILCDAAYTTEERDLGWYHLPHMEVGTRVDNITLRNLQNGPFTITFPPPQPYKTSKTDILKRSSHESPTL